jgi:hypothetical protein
MNDLKKHVLRTDQLSGEALNALFNQEVLAVVVPNYTDSIKAIEVGETIAKDERVEKYFYEVAEAGERKRLFLGVSRFGVSFSTTFGKPRDGDDAQTYYSIARPNIQRLRSLFHPQLSPIDKFRLELDELVPAGANLANFEGRKMFTGIARVTHADMELQEKHPHVDSLPPGYSITSQFSANIFLTAPDEGGELIVYPMSELSPAEADDFDTNKKLWAKELENGVRIKPNPGDLILINTRRPHAVAKFTGSTRVSIQTFFGRSADGRLQLWC